MTNVIFGRLDKAFEKLSIREAATSPEVKDIEALVERFNLATTPKARQEAGVAIRMYINTKLDKPSESPFRYQAQNKHMMRLISDALGKINNDSEKKWALRLLSKPESAIINKDKGEGPIPPAFADAGYIPIDTKK